jgi:hypothetical protein
MSPDRGYGGGNTARVRALGGRDASRFGRPSDLRRPGVTQKRRRNAVRADRRRLPRRPATAADRGGAQRADHSYPPGRRRWGPRLGHVSAAAIGAALREEDILEAALAAARTPEMTDGLRDVGELLPTPPDPVQTHARLGSSSYARESVCAGIYAALAHPTFEPAVRFAVRLGGDTDTIAAMTGAISAARLGARSTAPMLPSARSLSTFRRVVSRDRVGERMSRNYRVHPAGFRPFLDGSELHWL